jgi:hypothetical protein
LLELKLELVLAFAAELVVVAFVGLVGIHLVRQIDPDLGCIAFIIVPGNPYSLVVVGIG